MADSGENSVAAVLKRRFHLPRHRKST